MQRLPRGLLEESLANTIPRSSLREPEEGTRQIDVISYAKGGGYLAHALSRSQLDFLSRFSGYGSVRRSEAVRTRWSGSGYAR
jgi:hypothetical protein